jgi:VWFA-related protein
VLVDVVVSDKNGRPVSDLRLSDFVVKESGRVQDIATFEFVSVPVVRHPLQARSDPSMEADVPNAVAPVSGRAFVVVIDDLHLLPQHLILTQRVVSAVLESIPLGDNVAIMFSGRDDVGVPFTTDRDAQGQVLGRIKGTLGFAQDPRPVTSGPEEHQRYRHALDTIAALGRAVMSLSARHSERRAVILISEGLNYDFNAGRCVGRACSGGYASALPGNPPENVMDASGVFDSLRELYRRASQASVSISTVDPRGNIDVDSAVIGWIDGDLRRQVQSKMLLQANFLRNVAEQSGGIAQVRRSDMDGGIKEILENATCYYLLGYLPEPLVRDGKYHSIDVQVRRSGMHVRARRGYVAERSR